MNLASERHLANGGWLFERVNGVFNVPVGDVEPGSPPVDVVEDESSYRFSMEIPGLKCDSLEVKVEDKTLVITAERIEPVLAKEARVLRAERHYCRIHRAFRLPTDVGHDAIKAAYKDGVLEVTIAKLPLAKAVKVEVAYSN
jgi:HSP20 family protein